jgi:hypothetical protein
MRANETRLNMKYSEVYPSPFVKAGDIGEKEPVLTIAEVTTETVGDGDERRCLSFEETNKKLLLNKTNWLKCAELTGQDDDEKWIGHRIRLTKKPVPFRGDVVDAVRVDAADRPF